MSTNQPPVIARFVALANSISSALGLNASHHIPPDGAITMRRFRRTISWHIVNQPNGHLTSALRTGTLTREPACSIAAPSTAAWTSPSTRKPAEQSHRPRPTQRSGAGRVWGSQDPARKRRFRHQNCARLRCADAHQSPGKPHQAQPTMANLRQPALVRVMAGSIVRSRCATTKKCANA